MREGRRKELGGRKGGRTGEKREGWKEIRRKGGEDRRKGRKEEGMKEGRREGEKGEERRGRKEGGKEERREGEKWEGSKPETCPVALAQEHYLPVKETLVT